MMGVVMVATVLLYSGRENPSWRIPADRAADVVRAIDAMPEIVCPPPTIGGLGYTGVRLSVKAPESVERIWTFAGSIAMSDQRCFADAGRKVERMVLRTGRSHIDPAVFASILPE
jgi:hypothetical protein